MSRRQARLKKLEAAAVESDRKGRLVEPQDDEEWLAEFEARAEAGHFAREPEFPVALEAYRTAIAAAKAQTDPPWDPPADFMASLTNMPHLRRLNWRERGRFPDVDAGWTWLAEMSGRAFDGVPSVTVAEFEQLFAWFEASVDRLRELASAGSWLIHLADGSRTDCANIRCALRAGPKAQGAGKVAEVVRELRSRLGPPEEARLDQLARRTFARLWARRQEPEVAAALTAFREAVATAERTAGRSLPDDEVFDVPAVQEALNDLQALGGTEGSGDADV